MHSEGTGLVQNNSIVLAISASNSREFRCISASKSANVGQLVAPNGNVITNNSLIVTVGGPANLGLVSLQLQNSETFATNNQGVYSCIIPDENGVQQYLHFGIYFGRFNSTY